ncbi:glycosyl hydrolase 115 family protein [Reichenbachiella ulvae]|uniref:Glycosyl hydrolase 115 family protein n=1 Tax=Reichenbachiella ulvae TaxID=2980104 RepID=A0ABT3CTP3_9BACT|nr:glycosyl hydrolase 115 family protein [Reichenbachiella ulvae]MCV9386608.1 glycosyl hydrolase 115 family protein [Reichenbachiella ulvae]
MNYYQLAGLLLLSIMTACTQTPEQKSDEWVSFESRENFFPIYEDGTVANLYVDQSEDEGILIAAQNLQKDLTALTGQTPQLFRSKEEITAGKLIIIGNTNDEVITSLDVDTKSLKGKWEQFLIQGISNPFGNGSEALVISGSDKRGAIFGIYELSEKMGVSPWYFWADVPIQKQNQIFVNPNPYTTGEPKVKYRGIFINDEAPALSGWAYSNFGGFNSEFYAHVFELILRSKGNYLWPAMWGRSIYEDDPKSPILADKMGIVLGTSHHEPLTRAHADWGRKDRGPWNYVKNKENLRQFWREGAERMGDKESLLTIGMRGDGDEPMTEGTAIELLETIVADQRQIIEEVTGKPAKETPQIWALYKEVQEYYDKGMRVDDDITLLLCDDNWGNIRKLPAYGDTARSGGYGIYYHFDYVGGPRNYKWINTTQISRVWEQMTTAYDYGVDQVWIVNVGDIKPMEFPISFFLDLAWDPEAIKAEDIPQYGVEWAANQFDETSSELIADLLNQYTLFNSRRKPELLDQNTYSLVRFNEFERIVEDYKALAEKAKKVKKELSPEYHDAYFQLVEFPIAASTNLNEMYFEVAKNRMYATQGRQATALTAQKAQELYGKDSLLTQQYHQLKDGKWNHMMSQTHIGYTYWQQPDVQAMPEVTTDMALIKGPQAGFMIENSSDWWPEMEKEWALPNFDSRNDQRFYIEVFSRGSEASSFAILADNSPLSFSEQSGNIDSQQRIEIKVDWEKVNDSKTGEFSLVLNQDTVSIAWKVTNIPEAIGTTATVINNGMASIQAIDYDQKKENETISWLTIPQMGKTASTVVAQPSYAKSEILDANTPHLEYNIYLMEATDSLKVKVVTAPTMNYHNDEGLSYAISFDDQEAQIVNIHSEENYVNWYKQVADNATFTTTTHGLDSGQHTLNIWHIDSKIPFQRLDLITGQEPYSYLGQP